MPRLFSLTFFVLVSFVSQVVSASDQGNAAVLRSFLKLSTMVETGINFRDYNAALADVKLELKMRNGDESTPNPSLGELQKALKLYSEAGMLWQLSLGRSGKEMFMQDDPLQKEYMERFPEANKPINEGGAMLGDTMHVKQLIGVVWAQAEKYVEAAQLAEAKATAETKPLPRKPERNNRR